MIKKIKAVLITAAIITVCPALLLVLAYCAAYCPEYILVTLSVVLIVIGVVDIYKGVLNHIK